MKGQMMNQPQGAPIGVAQQSQHPFPLRTRPDGSPLPPAVPWSELFDRIAKSENKNLIACLTADLNSYMLGEALLSTRKESTPQSFLYLIARFRLTLAAMDPLARGESAYAPQQDRTQVLDEVERAIMQNREANAANAGAEGQQPPLKAERL